MRYVEIAFSRFRVPRFALASIALLCAVTTMTASATAAEIALLPREISLHGPVATQRLLVLGTEAGRFVVAPQGDVQITSSDPAIAKIEGDMVVPLSDGTVTLTATIGESKATARVTVAAFDTRIPWSFRNHVQPMLAKYGCSTGACHGALAGKGGFRLSLFGYDSGTDYHTIAKQSRGRRVELADPGRSLLLTKPTNAIPHKGGVRFDVDSHPYNVLTEWITQGAAPPREEDARLERIEVLPSEIVLTPGVEQQLLVRAHYTDGRVEDVTDAAIYKATNSTVAGVGEDGKITVNSHGEGAFTAWFSSQIVVARVSVPYPNEVADEIYTNAPRRNFIDELVLDKLKSLRLPPSPPCTDEEFIRRAYVTSIGRIPTIDETREFLADTSPSKRDKMIELLLETDDFVDYWAYRWSDVLLLSSKNIRPESLKAYYHWIRGHVDKNTPWDVMVREILTSKGSSLEQGPTNFFAVHQTPEDMTENAAQAFLGLSIGCARCHNHPLEKWTNDQYYAMANIFARVRAKGWGGESSSGNGFRSLVVTDRGDLIQPRTGRPMPPAPLDATPLEIDDPVDRRGALATWLTAPENPYFARSIGNRIWANYFNVGIVDREDDMRLSNPASNQPLMDAVAKHLVDNKFDLRSLMRVIMQSETFQRSSQPLPGNAKEERFYSRYYPRRMMAEVLHDSIVQVTGVPTIFDKVTTKGAGRTTTDDYKKGTRAIQIYDSAVQSYFLSTFGRNDREIVCECERSYEPSMVQVLHISNGDTLNKKLAAEGNTLDALLAAGLSNEKLIEHAYTTTLSRGPTISEKTKLIGFFAGADAAQRRIILEDIFWGLMSSQEFLFNH